MNEASVFTLDRALIGEKLGEGVTAQVFAYGEDEILKQFIPAFGEDEVRREYLGGLVAQQAGLPVPRMTGVSYAGDRWVMAQERIRGESMLKVLLAPDADVDALLDACLRLLVRIHACRVDKTALPRQSDVFTQRIMSADELTAQEKQALLALMATLPAGDRLCHMDYHFDNILVRDGEPIVIDWNDAMCGNPATDVARAQLLSRQTVLPDFIPAQAMQVLNHVSDTVLTKYPALYKQYGGTLEDLDAWTAIVAAARLCCENQGNHPMLLKTIRGYLAAHKG